MTRLSQAELTKLLNDQRSEIADSERYFNVTGNSNDVRSIGGLGPAQSAGGSSSSGSAGGQVSGFAAMTALLSSIAQDMRIVANIVSGGSAGQQGGGAPNPMVVGARGAVGGNSSSAPSIPSQTMHAVDSFGHVIAPSVDGQPSYMSRVAEKASWGNLNPQVLAWDVIGHANRFGTGMSERGTNLVNKAAETWKLSEKFVGAPASALQAEAATMGVAGTNLARVGAAVSTFGAIAGPVAGAALSIGMKAQEAWIAGTQPLHDLNVQITRATAAGQYVDTMQRKLLTQAAGMQGTLDSARSWGGWVDWVPGYGEERIRGYREQELSIAKVQGQAESVMTKRNISAYSSPGRFDYVNNYDYDGTLDVSQGLAKTLRPFGAKLTDTVSSVNETDYLKEQLRHGYTPDEILNPVARATALATSPGGGGMKAYIDSLGEVVDPRTDANLRAQSKSLQDKISANKRAMESAFIPGNVRVELQRQNDAMSAQSEELETKIQKGAARTKSISQRQAEYDAAAGDVTAVANNPERDDTTMGFASSQLGLKSTGLIAGYETQRASNVATKYMAQGTGYNMVNAAREEAAKQSSLEAAMLRKQADAIPDNANPEILVLKRSLIVQAEGKEAQSSSFIQSATFYQNQQESMQFGAAEQIAGISTTRGLYGYGSLQGFQTGMSGQISAVGNTAANRRQQAARPGLDPGQQSALLAQAAQKELEQSVTLPRQATIGTISLEDQAMEARRRSAAVSTGKAYYSGDIDQFDVAIAGEIGLSKENAALKRRQAKYKAQTDPERGLLETTAQEEDINQIGLHRRSAETHYATSMTQASALQQQAGAQMTVAQLIGGGKEAFDAATKSVEAFGMQIQAITDRLAKHDLGPEETAEKEGQRDVLREQQHAAILQRDRAKEEAAVSIAGAQASGAKSIAAGAFARGVGGPGAAGVTAGVMRGAENEYTQSVALLNKLGEQARHDNVSLSDSVAYQNQLAVVQAKDANRALTSVDMAANTPLSIGSRRAESAGAFQLNVLTSTYTPFGNIRGALANQMGIYGGQLRELNTMRQQQMRDHPGEWSEENEFAFQQRRQDIGGKLIGAQQQYEQGFMDRIIASTYNAPSSFKGIASQFTAREAAPFMQAMGTNWGFTDAKQRDHMMFRYPRLANSIVGMPGSEGFISAAMGGAGGMYGGGGGGGPIASHMEGARWVGEHMVGGHMEGGHVHNEYIGHLKTRTWREGGHMVGGHMEPGHWEGGHLVRDAVPGGGILKGGGSLGVQTIRVIVELVEKGTKIGVGDSTHIISTQQNTLNVTLPAVSRPGVRQ